jgi:cysteinyl-tRNA synthetase
MRFREAMDDDFNTPLAFAALFDLASEINRTHSPALAAQLKALGGIVGLLQRDPSTFLQAPSFDAFLKLGKSIVEGMSATPEDSETERIDAAIAARIAAKKDRNFAEADRIRKELADAGIVLEDSASGTTWRRA